VGASGASKACHGLRRLAYLKMPLYSLVSVLKAGSHPPMVTPSCSPSGGPAPPPAGSAVYAQLHLPRLPSAMRAERQVLLQVGLHGAVAGLVGEGSGTSSPMTTSALPPTPAPPVARRSPRRRLVRSQPSHRQARLSPPPTARRGHATLLHIQENLVLWRPPERKSTCSGPLVRSCLH
jgi:hypothetical protein